MHRFLIILVVSVLLVIGCEQPFQPVEPSQEEEENGGNDMSQRDYAQTNGTPSSWSNNAVFHNIEYINDGDDNSYADAGTAAGPGVYVEGEAHFIVTLDKARYIETIKYITLFGYNIGGAGGGGAVNFWLEYYDGVWKTLYSGTAFEAKTTRIFSAGYTNVSKIRVRAYFMVQGGTSTPTTVYANVYTEASLAEYLPDSGLRVKGSGSVIAIGRDTTLTGHKLRYAKGGVIYAIPLLNPSSPYAGPLRIFDGSAVKALPRVSD